MSTVLVTGGCGFIGSNFIRHLLRADPSVRVLNLDCLTYAGNPDNLRDLEADPRYRFVRGNINDRRLVARLFARELSAVFHLAAESHVDRSLRDSRPFVETNVLGTQTLLEAARTFGVGRFIHVSTDEVYGDAGPTRKFDEQAALAPNNPYAASKAAADMLVRSYVAAYDVPAIITRATNNYGPCQYPEKLIPFFITRLMQDEAVPLYGDGQQVRDWLHVNDHCRALEAVWRRGRTSEIYNIAGNCERTNLKITRLLLRELDKPASLVQFVADRPGHDRRYALDCTKIQRELGWRPRIRLEVGLRDAVRWYEENPDWLAQVRRRSPLQVRVRRTKQRARSRAS